MASISDADSELLSAYLDNQLLPSEKAAVEQRLERDEQLRNELADLRATVSLLRELEPVRPPRSFTLDPATVAAPQRSWFPIPILRYGSAVSALLLVVTLMFDAANTSHFSMSSSGAGAPAAMQAPANAPMAATSATAPASAERSMVSGAANEATAAPAAGAQSPAAMQAPAEPTAEAGVADQTAGTSMVQEQAPEAALAPTAETESGPLAASGDVTSSNTSSPDTAIYEAKSMPPEAPSGPRPLLLIEIGLGALAVLLLIASLYLSRRARR